MKRIIFWASFVVILALIIWGLIVAMNKPAPSTTVGTPAPVTSTDHVRGSDKAKVTLIAYEDFQCPACATYYPYVEKLLSEYPNDLRLVFRHFPLSQHKNAIPAALASEAADKQGKFWEMYSKIYENQIEWAESPNAESIFEKYASAMGLDLAKYQSDIKDSSLKSKILSDQEEGIKINVNQTPSFFVNGQFVQPRNYDEFKTIIETAASSTN